MGQTPVGIMRQKLTVRLMAAFGCAFFALALCATSAGFSRPAQAQSFPYLETPPVASPPLQILINAFDGDPAAIAFFDNLTLEVSAYDENNVEQDDPVPGGLELLHTIANLIAPGSAPIPPDGGIYTEDAIEEDPDLAYDHTAAAAFFTTLLNAPDTLNYGALTAANNLMISNNFFADRAVMHVWIDPQSDPPEPVEDVNTEENALDGQNRLAETLAYMISGEGSLGLMALALTLQNNTDAENMKITMAVFFNSQILPEHVPNNDPAIPGWTQDPPPPLTTCLPSTRAAYIAMPDVNFETCPWDTSPHLRSMFSAAVVAAMQTGQLPGAPYNLSSQSQITSEIARAAYDLMTAVIAEGSPMFEFLVFQALEPLLTDDPCERRTQLTGATSPTGAYSGTVTDDDGNEHDVSFDSNSCPNASIINPANALANAPVTGGTAPSNTYAGDGGINWVTTLVRDLNQSNPATAPLPTPPSLEDQGEKPLSDGYRGTDNTEARDGSEEGIDRPCQTQGDSDLRGNTNNEDRSDYNLFSRDEDMDAELSAVFGGDAYGGVDPCTFTRTTRNLTYANNFQGGEQFQLYFADWLASETWVHAIQAMTAQITAAIIDQTRMIASTYDAMDLANTAVHIQTREMEAKKGVIPSENACVALSPLQSLPRSESFGNNIRGALKSDLYIRASTGVR